MQCQAALPKPDMQPRQQLLGDGCSPADGPDFSPDDRHLFFSSEMASGREGHAQNFRHDLVAREMRQLTFDDRMNWFPHPSPDGRRFVYLSYESGTVAHPPDRPVALRTIDLPQSAPRSLVTVFGGQVTINVPSWAPDSRELSYLAYPIGEE
jgi:TolB protein